MTSESMSPGVGGRLPLVGGLGAQSLMGGDDDDLIFADLADGAEAVRVAALAQLRDGGEAAAGPAQVTGVLHEGAVRFYGAGASPGLGGGGGWTVGAGDVLTPVWSQSAFFYDADDLLTGAPAIEAFEWDGFRWLVTGGFGVSLARLDAGGVPEPLDSAPATFGSGLMRPGAFAPLILDGTLHVLVGGGADGGLSLLRFDPFGLTLVSRVEDAPGVPLAAISGLETVEIGGRPFAVATSRMDGALSVWSLEGGTPALTDERGLGDGETGFDLIDAAGTALLRDGSRVYVWAVSEGRSIGYRLSEEGRLERVASEAGATAVAAVRFGGVDHLLTAEVGGEVVLRVPGSGGRLVEVARFLAGEGAEITGLAAVVEGDRVLILLSRADAGGHDLIAYRPEGDDVVDGGDGDDEIHGGAGADTLLGGGGNDRLLGGAGDDALFDGPGDDTLEGGDDDDRLEAGEGRDSLDGGGGDDRLEAGAGNDALLGGAGDDVLEGGGGRDQLEGGGGRDRLEGGGGRDRLDGGGGHDVLEGGGGRDRLDGGGGRDDLSAGGGRDVLDGGGGRDALDGGGGRDALDGGGGKDRLDGGGGRDRLEGGKGRDVLEGGGGRDVFVFGPREGRDRIEDFGRGRDRIAFEGEGDFGDLRIKQKKGDAFVIFEGTKVLLEDVEPDSLGPGDFLFG